jgi:hypothetical protein
MALLNNSIMVDHSRVIAHFDDFILNEVIVTKLHDRLGLFSKTCTSTWNLKPWTQKLSNNFYLQLVKFPVNAVAT